MKPNGEVGGTSEPPTRLSPTQPDPNLQERPFLVLDVRDQDEYNLCHIITGNFYFLLDIN